ncbi:MAG: peptide/nickel transport system permease protein [Thermoleophilaceae bacterium]|jgi:peptide/nickel transport system permease protein|nr:peptide/nickel transport system permease protein [Thermoleophilaceae bacterium]
MSQAAVLLFILLAGACLAAPLYEKHVAGRGASETAVTDTIEVDGERVDVVSPDGVPIGPGWRAEYLLGADQLGRDVMVRMLYGGRNSLLVGIVAALITLVLAVLLGLMAGYLGGFTDRAISSLFDVMWSFPVLLFAIALGTALALGGLNLGFTTLEGSSIWIPTVIIGVVFVPYLGRPVRGQVMSLRERPFVEAAVAQGMGPGRIMFGEILPNLVSTLLVFTTLIVANNILTETALSFLGAGIQPPEPSWGNLIGDGAERIVSAPHLSLVPGAAIALTVLALNIFGDGLGEALNPRAKVRVK